MAEAAERLLPSFNLQELSELYQAHLLAQASAGSFPLRFSPTVETAGADVWRASVHDVRMSRLQEAVSAALSGLGVAHEQEGLTEDGLFSLDLALRAERVAVEVDGPSHFVRLPGDTRAASGPTRARRRLLEVRGWRVASVPYWEWDELRGERAAQKEYLRRLLRPLLPSRGL